MQRVKLFLPLIVLLLLLPLFYVGLKLDPTAMPSALIGKPVPAFTLITVDDKELIIDQDYFTGKVTLLNVWASWCYACRIEHPYLNLLAEQGVHIIGINYKDQYEAAQKWLQDLHNPYEFSVFDEQGRLGIDLGVTGAPETYVIGKDGSIRYRHIGVVNEAVWQNTLLPLYQSLQQE
ncbi:MAG TPA: DsbE family thiol:disulfide interchange protein [Cellvibrionaceae bacterium]